MTWLKIVIQTLTHLIGKKADKREVEQLRRDTIPAPATASPGQTIIVKTVDDYGKPIEWEAGEAGGSLRDLSDVLIITNIDHVGGERQITANMTYKDLLNRMTTGTLRTAMHCATIIMPDESVIWQSGAVMSMIMMPDDTISMEIHDSTPNDEREAWRLVMHSDNTFSFPAE